LERVCSDGSSKFPKFTVPTINRLIADGGETRRAALVVAAWAVYLKGVDENGVTYSIPDPRAAFCQALVADDALVTQRMLEVEEIFGTSIPRSPEFVAAFEWCCNSLREHGVTRTLERVLADAD
jgi:mannitol 2-dehydrogenase